MLHHLGMLKSLRVEAFGTAMYIGNRTLAKAPDGRTYHERMYDAKLDPVSLRAFGAPCAIVRPSEKSKKRVWTVGWATSISGAHAMQVHGGGQARLAHRGRSLRVLSTSANRCYFGS